MAFLFWMQLLVPVTKKALKTSKFLPGIKMASQIKTLIVSYFGLPFKILTLDNETGLGHEKIGLVRYSGPHRI